MEPQLDERLKNIEKELRDIHGIVLKTRKVQRTASTIRALYWIFIILLGLGAFYFVQPFIGQLKDSYGLGGSTFDSSNGNSLNELYKQLNGQKQ